MPKITVSCPVCIDGSIEAEVRIDPGTTAVTSGPSDGWYPGDPPEVAEILSKNYECRCRQGVAHLLQYDLITRQKVIDTYDAYVDDHITNAEITADMVEDSYAD